MLQKALTAKSALDEYVRNRNPETQRAMLNTGFELNDELLRFHEETGYGEEGKDSEGNAGGSGPTG